LPSTGDAGSQKIQAQMIIPEILEHIEDADLEDWLTAAFIEHLHELPLKELCSSGGYPSASRVADIWMVEITGRNEKVWSGKFNLEFSEESKNGSETGHLAEHQTGELLFTLDTTTAEITFNTDAWTLGRKKDLGSELVAS
jgi:hypothetical protein